MTTVVNPGASTQTYQTFVYNSSGAQSGNRFNNFANLLTAMGRQEGRKLLIAESNETIPAGTYGSELDYATIAGNGLEYDVGGFTWTFGDNVTFASWKSSRIEQGIRILSTSTTGNIISASNWAGIQIESTANVHSTTYPFFKNTGGGQVLHYTGNNGRSVKLSGGCENIDCTAGAWATQMIHYREAGTAVTSPSNIFKSTNAVVFLDIIGSIAIASPANWPSTQANLNIGLSLPLNFLNADILPNVPTGNLAATNVQSALNELQTDVDTRISNTLPAAKGDLFSASANDTPAVLTVGANDTVLVADSAQTTGNKWAKRPRVLDVQYTTVGNVGTGEDDLQTYTMPANTLATTGDSIRLETQFSVVNNANQKRVKFYFGGTALFDTQPTGLAVSTAYTIKIDLLMICTGSNTQKYSLEYTAPGGLLGTLSGTLAITDTATIIIKGTGETNAASNNDVTQLFMKTNYDPI